MRWQPNIKIVPHYDSHPYYIKALSISIKKTLKKLNYKPDLIVASYHGIPQKSISEMEILIIAIVTKLLDC